MDVLIKGSDLKTIKDVRNPDNKFFIFDYLQRNHVYVDEDSLKQCVINFENVHYYTLVCSNYKIVTEKHYNELLEKHRAEKKSENES